MAKPRKSGGKGRSRKGSAPGDPAQRESLGVERSDRDAGRPVQLDRSGEQPPAATPAGQDGGHDQEKLA